MYSDKINKNDPFAISKFEKEIKRICYSIKDETLKKYILEDFLLKIKELTPIQNIKKNFQSYQSFRKKQDFQMLNETKKLFKQKNHFTKEQIKEYSILFIMLNHTNIPIENINQLSDIKFSNNEFDDLKNEILEVFSTVSNSMQLKEKVSKKYKSLINEIETNSNISNFFSKKNNDEKIEMLGELLNELKELNHLKKIENLEHKLSENLDESSYSEFIKLKNELNRE